ncbi:hypothetical protein B0H21DRAFT_827535 [Amylocystis lapponica]|nr:hypothetical protein B0H21DRAFT_827535 [Amylocystis lapponica]
MHPTPIQTLSDLSLSTPCHIPRHEKTTDVDIEQDAPLNKLYQHSWFSSGFAAYRPLALKSYLLSNLFNLVIVWGALAILYGAFYKNNVLDKINVYVTDLDGGFLGAQIVDAFQASLQQPNHLNLIFDSSFTDVQQVRDAVYDEQAWAAVAINAGVSSSLSRAFATGNTSYDPAFAVELVSEGARNPLTSNSHTVPAVLAVLEPALAAASLNATQTFLSANNDLRPAYNAAAFGAILSGVTALMVFTFTVCGTANQIGVLLGEHLDIPSTIVWRIATCLLSYLLIALSLTGVQAAFGMPVTAVMGARGFVVLWMLNWMTVSAMGFVLESVVTIFGFWICNWFLNFWVFWNVSGVSFTLELMPGFYRYYSGFPILQGVQGTNTIVYGTKSHLSANFGVLIGWTVGFAIVMSVATVVRLKWNTRQGFHRLP